MKKKPKPKARRCAVPGCQRITLHEQCDAHRSVVTHLLSRLMRKALA